VSESENPVVPSPQPAAKRPRTNRDWWPNQIDLQVLHQHSERAKPRAAEHNYAEEFKKLDLDALRQDILTVMTTSHEWWPADHGNYGPLFVRMSWHSAGTYRIEDGRGGQLRGAECRHERVRLPMAARRVIRDARAARTAGIAAQ